MWYMLESASPGCKSENEVFFGLEFLRLKNFCMVELPPSQELRSCPCRHLEKRRGEVE